MRAFTVTLTLSNAPTSGISTVVLDSWSISLAGALGGVWTWTPTSTNNNTGTHFGATYVSTPINYPSAAVVQELIRSHGVFASTPGTSYTVQ